MAHYLFLPCVAAPLCMLTAFAQNRAASHNSIVYIRSKLRNDRSLQSRAESKLAAHSKWLAWYKKIFTLPSLPPI